MTNGAGIDWVILFGGLGIVLVIVRLWMMWSTSTAEERLSGYARDQARIDKTLEKISDELREHQQLIGHTGLKEKVEAMASLVARAATKDEVSAQNHALRTEIIAQDTRLQRELMMTAKALEAQDASMMKIIERDRATTIQMRDRK